MSLQGLFTHTRTIQGLGESTIILPHARNALDGVGGYIYYELQESVSELYSQLYSRKPKKKNNKLQPIVWLTLCIQLIVILPLGIRVRLTVCIRISA
jgi:hypothetical protein